MKKETLQRRVQIANDIMYYIYTHIDTYIEMDELARDLHISKFHMHRIFKEVFGKNIYESVKSIRLQKASNLLLTNRYSTITEIANLCGYSAQASFIRAFSNRFSMTPKAWRKGGYKLYSEQILQQSKARESQASFETLQPTIVKMPSMDAYYIRHRGYNDGIKQTWQKIHAWILTHDITQFRQIALFHDNPTITPLEDCAYVACIVSNQSLNNIPERLPKFKIAEGVYARFDLQAKHGDLLKFIHWVYHEWLPLSEFETTTKPPYVIYRKNNYITEGNNFDLSFYVSIQF